MGPKRDWSDAIEKRDAEGCCRVCGIQRGMEAAHVTGRKHDKPKEGRKTLWVNPDSIVPLCPPCHEDYDAHQLDLLKYTFKAEQVKAVEDLGSIELARQRLCPSEYRQQKGNGG
jgi:hypothetical protein